MYDRALYLKTKSLKCEVNERNQIFHKVIFRQEIHSPAATEAKVNATYAARTLQTVSGCMSDSPQVLYFEESDTGAESKVKSWCNLERNLSEFPGTRKGEIKLTKQCTSTFSISSALLCPC